MNIDKFYTRCWKGQPESALIEHARRGFWTLGIETGKYEGDEGLARLTDLGPRVGVSGWISDVHAALRMLDKPIPVNVDYPEELRDLLGRTITDSTVGEVRARTDRVFIKPKEHKAFSGLVWDGSEAARRAIVTIEDNLPVFASTIVDFVSEYRSFILNGEILDVRLYKGDWSVAPQRAVVESAVQAMKTAPVAYCLDFGCTRDGRTLLVEMNDGFAFGHYGLHEVSYAKMLAARWEQLTA